MNYKSLLCTVYCPVLPTPANGMITYSSESSTVRPVGTVATYICNTGFVLALNSGTERRTCQSNRLWIGSPPTCAGRQSFTTIHSYGGCIICFPIQKLAQTSLYQPMEVSNTTLQELVGIDQPALWLPTVVTLATELMAPLVEPVYLIHGVAVQQLVQVCKLCQFKSQTIVLCIQYIVQSLYIKCSVRVKGVDECYCPLLVYQSHTHTHTHTHTVLCPREDLTSGMVTYSSGNNLLLPLATATYSCVPGYKLTGNVMRTCVAVTGWTGSLPACTR